MFRNYEVLCSEGSNYVPKTWKFLYSEGSIFRNFRLCIPLRVGCRYKDSHGGSHRHTGLNSCYGANHVFPERNHNVVGPIIRDHLGAITEYLVNL